MKSHLIKKPLNGSSSLSGRLSNNTDRTIIHVDMNSFFASVEQVCNPKLRGKPIFVCGEGRTIVTTASYEARRFGIKTGMSRQEALRLCPQAVPVIGNHRKYLDTSERIWDILVYYTNKVEIFSIDEAFMDITNIIESFSGGTAVARDIKEKIKEELGLTCSIGIAPNKLLAKLGSDMQKPDGLVVIRKEDIADVLKDLPVDKFCGIGEKTKKKLESIGIKTAKELGDADEGFLRNYFGIIGHFLKNMGRGIDNSEVKCFNSIETVKSVGHSYTLPKNTTDDNILNSYLLWLSDKVGRRMRQAGLTGRVVYFVLRYGDFKTLSKQMTLKHYIDGGHDIYKAALRIMNGVKPFAKPVRLLGVSISGLMPKKEQLCLFTEDKKKLRFQKVVDEIKDTYGEDSLIFSGVQLRRSLKKSVIG
ncbi:MAG: DNA polymerase IV [bacterium]